ncbi:uncharacterized protein LOC113523179 isoform X2 [Galleria mellonella]|uniref:Uncharacterized protein LOC113523179 isoform X2 n=1 Tax=Galleria mellonella TaxID=7137 RepID=A0ABM3MTQ8_GALME|nr:uncharacterized protein LOC113523179 isoform X2 [Galleria mellonella]
MRVIGLVLLLLMWKKDYANSVRIVELRVSTHAAEGGEALLGCEFDLEGDVLYSLKWYKDNREFYRYSPLNDQPVTHFSTPGVIVDLIRSTNNVVALKNLTQESAGVYRCEVTGEAPNFMSVSSEKRISVYLLPKGRPKIFGLQKQYEIGDKLLLNCTSPPSQPEAQLTWLLNERPAPEEYLMGPWYKISTEHPEAPMRAKLKLNFIVRPEHYVNGVMTLRCRATIAPLYHQETNCTYYLNTPTVTTTLVAPSFEFEQMTAEDNNIVTRMLSRGCFVGVY